LVEIRHQPKPFPAVFEILFSGVFVACFVPFIGGTWTGAALGMAPPPGCTSAPTCSGSCARTARSTRPRSLASARRRSAAGWT
ncbi:hypothetical protein D0N42_04245, partial [Micrococcus luteus]